MTHAFNSSTREAEASMVYKVSSRTARATEKPCLENKTTPQIGLLYLQYKMMEEEVHQYRTHAKVLDYIPNKGELVEPEDPEGLCEVVPLMVQPQMKESGQRQMKRH